MRRLLYVLVGVVAVFAAVFYAFSDPDIPRAALEAKYTNADSRFLDLRDGVRVHYRDTGPRDAPVLVLLHGSNASLHTWEPWTAILADEFRVVSLDLPGHGLTGATLAEDYSNEGMSRFVRDFAGALGLGRFALAGNSMGGAVAARFAIDNPGRLTHLVLLNSGGIPFEAGEGTPLVFRLARTPVVKNLLLYFTPRELAAEGLGKAIERKEILTGAMIDRYWEFARMEGQREATMIRFAIPWTNELADRLGEIAVPALILWGDKDRLVPVSVAHEFAARIPGSRLTIYEDVGHIPMEEVAEQSAADVRAFLRGAGA